MPQTNHEPPIDPRHRDPGTLSFVDNRLLEGEGCTRLNPNELIASSPDHWTRLEVVEVGTRTYPHRDDAHYTKENDYYFGSFKKLRVHTVLARPHIC